jgi:Mor family transcriptional regulator
MDLNNRAERNAKIYARRVDGLTLPAIAREFNLARETVREIIRCMRRKAQWREYDAKLRAGDK